MPSGEFMNRASLLPAIQSGKVSVATIDDKVRRIVRTAIEFGFLDRPQIDLGVPRYNEADRAVALQGAEESIVLLKNEGNLLPLNPTRVKTIAVLGPNAYPAVPVGGGSAAVDPFNSVSYLEGISNFLGSRANVLFDSGIVSTEDIMDRTQFTVDAAGKEPGLRGEYFNSTDFSGTPVIRTDRRVSFQWTGESLQGMVSKGPSIRWTGYFTATKTGSYYWLVNFAGRDSAKLYLDDKLVHESVPGDGRGPACVALPMSAGQKYAIRLEFVIGPVWNQQLVGLGVIAADDIVTPEAKKMAASADAVVVCVGFNRGSESEGFDRSFELGLGQDALVQAISAANPKTIVVLTAGGSADVTKWIDRVPALLHGWYSGQEAGRALPKILFGEVNPSGRLPISFERAWTDNPTHDSYNPNAPKNTVVYKEGVFVGYRGYERNGVKPLFPFGHGLSYTTFAFQNLKLAPAAPKCGENVTASFDLTNTGSRAGTAVAELYLGNPTASVPRPAKELKGFSRVALQPGETRHVTLKLDPRAMSFFDVTGHAWKQEPGKFTVFIGHSSAEIDLQGEYTVAP
jgi:beta-glucosidase